MSAEDSRTPNAPANGRKRFRVAFSFAGEKREFVAETAAILAKFFGEEAILYDKFHEAEFAVPRLAFSLPDLYRLESNLIVPVICKDYEKDWCGLEWDAIFFHIKEGREELVMLAHFDRAEGKGLNGLAGFVDLDDKTPAQFAVRILERLALNEDKPKNYYAKDLIVGGVSLGTEVLHNLPRQDPFFGRVEELRLIAGYFSKDARGWGVLIDGTGGIGKTALAMRAALEVARGRFRRIIFLSAKKSELRADGERSLEDFEHASYLAMINGIARELQKPELKGATEAELPEAVLHALRGAAVLLVLDNLETLPGDDRDRLFVFLNRLPDGCGGIVTSRRRSDVNAISFRIERLDRPAALELLKDLARQNKSLSAEESKWADLHAATGGNPLLMRWIAEHLRLGLSRTIDEAIEYLHQPAARNDPLEFIFGDLVDIFTKEEIKILAVLAHFTSPVAVNSIAELAEISEAVADAALSDLASRALVLPDREGRQYAPVPLVADFLRKKKPTEVEAAGDRLERRVYDLVMENGKRNYGRFPVLDAAWSMIAAAFGRFLIGDYGQLHTMCDAIRFFLEYKGRWNEWLTISREAEQRALSMGDFISGGWLAYQMGVAYNLRRQPDPVFECADRAERYWREVKGFGAQEEACAHQLRGYGYMWKQDYPAAVEVFRKALACWLSLDGESPDVSAGFNSLAEAEAQAGDPAAAERDYYEALRVADAVGYDEGTTTTTGNLADLALDRGDWSAAEAFARKALSLSGNVGHHEVALNNSRLAKALLRLDRKEDALPYARTAVDIFTELDSPDLAWAHKILAECKP